MKNLISPQRTLSNFRGGGVQYIPGHLEPFIDHIIKKYISSGKIKKALDLGGGGLRFALPASRYLDKIKVIDLDDYSLKVDDIAKYSKKIGNDAGDFKPEIIDVEKADILKFIKENDLDYDIILLSRVVHFFSPKEVSALVKTFKKKLKSKCLICVSVLVEKEKNTDNFNEFYKNSVAISANNHYRKFKNMEAVDNLRKSQNLPRHIHLFSKDYMVKIFGPDFILQGTPIWATRTVQGFIFKKK